MRLRINEEVRTGNRYTINLPMSENYDYDESYLERNGQVVTVFHDSAHLGGNEITRTHCIVEDDTGFRFIVRKLCLTPHQAMAMHLANDEAALLYEHGAIGNLDGDDNHLGSGDTSICNHE
tara:strand:+ start:619 stop:981 length:363 start_codon:yes stop_codon:yes gene_type:complete